MAADRSLIGAAYGVSGGRVTIHIGGAGQNVMLGLVDAQVELVPAQAVRLAALLLAHVDVRADWTREAERIIAEEGSS